MRKPYIVALGAVVVALAIGLIFTSVTTSKKYKFSRKATDVHAELIAKDHLLDPNTARKLMEAGDAKYMWIDVRNPAEFDKFHIEGAINIPLQRVLDESYVETLKNEKIKVFYSQESIVADQVRLLLTQYGYDNLMVLQGGVAYWQESVLSNDIFKAAGEYDDEKLLFSADSLKSQKK
jgi:rhodanese-related sulfurtransferase